MADCQMHLVRLLLAAYHTYTWMDPGLKVLLETDTWGDTLSLRCHIKVLRSFT